jgi:hypothetical protein
MTDVFNEFTNYYFAPIVFVVGFVGNLFGMIVLSRKRIKSKLHMTHIYMYLLASDMFYLITQLPLTNIQQSYPSINPLPLSSWFCKLWMYSDWSLVNTSPMIILYISVERLVNVKFTAKRLILRKNRNILIFTCSSVRFVCFFYFYLYVKRDFFLYLVAVKFLVASFLL